MNRNFIVAGLLLASAAIAFEVNTAEAGRCGGRRRGCCGYNQNYGYNAGGCNTGCSLQAPNACQPAPAGQLMAQPQAEMVAPPPPDAVSTSGVAPAPAPAPPSTLNDVSPAPPGPPAPSAKIAPEGETGTN